MKAKILVADGSDLVARVAGQLATRFGYCVTASVSCGVEALASARAHPPDLALVDLHMSGPVPGVQLASSLVQAGLRVLLLSGLPTARSRALADELGADGVLTKPFGTVEFRREVELALGRRRRSESAKVVTLR